MFTSLRVTRSVKRRRNESFQPGPASRSQKLFSPLCAPPLRRDVPRASFQLTDLPSEIGILIADRLGTASRASMVLVNRTTASWVSKGLLARVNACQLTDDAEALERDDSPETDARFVSAVGSSELVLASARSQCLANAGLLNTRRANAGARFPRRFTVKAASASLNSKDQHVVTRSRSSNVSFEESAEDEA